MDGESVKVFTTLLDALAKSPSAIVAALPGLGALYLMLIATKARTADKPEPKLDTEKLDKILAGMATLTEKVSHLESIAERVNSLAEKLARIEGRLDAEK